MFVGYLSSLLRRIGKLHSARYCKHISYFEHQLLKDNRLDMDNEK
jgi:hypothetical protein